MKKLLLLAACLAGSYCALDAQSVSDRDLIGNWQLVAFNTSGVFYDFDRDSLSLDRKSNMDPAREKEFIETIKARFQPYKEGSLIISADNRYVQIIPQRNTNAEGTYKLVSKDGKQFVSITCSDNSVEDVAVWKENDRICFDMPCKEGGGNAILMFRKQ